MSWIANDDTIIFNSDFNEKLDIELISRYKIIIFSDYVLNKKLFEFYENNKFNGLIYKESKFNKDVSKLPQGIIHLIFGHDFNQVISVLPSTLTHLTFGNNFNQVISVLPPTLTHLIFGHYFNQVISVLPSTLTHLIFGHDFNQVISVLPSALTHLTFGNNFNQVVSVLPPTLTHLTLGGNFNQQITFNPNIKYLKLHCDNQQLIDTLPNSITTLELGLGDYSFGLKSQVNNLPTSIKKLVFDIHSLYEQDLNCLPDYIEELQLNMYYRQRILNIPSNLKKLICYELYPHKDDFSMCEVETYTYP